MHVTSLQLKNSITEHSKNMKFCFLFSKSLSNTLMLLEKADGESAMQKFKNTSTRVAKSFCEDCASVEIGSGYPSTMTNDV